MEISIIYPIDIRKPFKYSVADFLSQMGRVPPKSTTFVSTKISTKCGGDGGREEATPIRKHFFGNKILRHSI